MLWLRRISHPLQCQHLIWVLAKSWLLCFRSSGLLVCLGKQAEMVLGSPSIVWETQMKLLPASPCPGLHLEVTWGNKPTGGSACSLGNCTFRMNKSINLWRFPILNVPFILAFHSTFVKGGVQQPEVHSHGCATDFLKRFLLQNWNSVSVKH